MTFCRLEVRRFQSLRAAGADRRGFAHPLFRGETLRFRSYFFVGFNAEDRDPVFRRDGAHATAKARREVEEAPLVLEVDAFCQEQSEGRAARQAEARSPELLNDFQTAQRLWRLGLFNGQGGGGGRLRGCGLRRLLLFPLALDALRAGDVVGFHALPPGDDAKQDFPANAGLSGLLLVFVAFSTGGFDRRAVLGSAGASRAFVGVLDQEFLKRIALRPAQFAELSEPNDPLGRHLLEAGREGGYRHRLQLIAADRCQIDERRIAHARTHGSSVRPSRFRKPFGRSFPRERALALKRVRPRHP